MAETAARLGGPTGCGSPAELDRLLAGSVTAAERSALVEHLSRCRRCRRRLAERQDLGASIVVTETTPRQLKERAVALAAPAGRIAPAPAAGAGERRQAGRRLRTPARRLVAAAAAAAGLAAVVGLPAWLAPRGASEPGEVRALEPAVAPPRLTAAEWRADEGSLDLRWSATPGAAAYRLVVVDGVGEVVLQVDLDGSRRGHRVDLEALPPGRPCYWYVQARFADGTRLASATEALPRVIP
jgi:hypothetical protein